MNTCSGNVTEVRNPANFVTKFAYGNGSCPSCGGSQLSALTDPKGNTWNFSYDQYGRLTNTSNPLGQAKAYNYDKMSRVTQVKDPAGNITSYAYDALNRLTKKDIQTTAGIHSITDYTYDAVGNLLNIANGDSSVSYTYDQLNRPITTSQTFAGKTYPIAYAYDAAGNRTSMITPWGKYSYTYDALNRLTSILNPQGITAAFTYDAVGRRTSKKIFKSTPELLVETYYTYDAAGELLSIKNKAGNKVVAFANYEYDAAGNRIRKEDQNGVEKYRYDAVNRLITAEPVPFDMAKAEGFVYDKNGNRRFDRGAKDYKYDAANRLLYNSIYTYTHDANGNLTSRTEIASSATITYSYNPEQHLSEVTTPKDKLVYKYDPTGRRTKKTVNGAAVKYVYDNEDIIAVLDNNDALTEIFTHGPAIDEPLIMTRFDGSSYYYHSDGLGSIMALTNDKTHTAEAYTYKIYGQLGIKGQKGVTLDKSIIGNPYSFTARELDSESGLYYYRARYYDYARGAFSQEDPIGAAIPAQNRFIYAGDNPIINRDAYGLFFEKIWSDPSERAQHYDEAVTLDVFLKKTEGISSADILGKMSNSGMGALSAGGPDGAIRYVVNPTNPAEVIAMRHFFVVGRQTEIFGFGVEYFQLARGYYDSAFNAQDFLPNYLGTKYYSGLDSNLSWRVQLQKFFNNEKGKAEGNRCEN